MFILGINGLLRQSSSIVFFDYFFLFGDVLRSVVIPEDTLRCGKSGGLNMRPF